MRSSVREGKKRVVTHFVETLLRVNTFTELKHTIHLDPETFLLGIYLRKE
jgi:hypothetical protein